MQNSSHDVKERIGFCVRETLKVSGSSHSWAAPEGGRDFVIPATFTVISSRFVHLPSFFSVFVRSTITQFENIKLLETEKKTSLGEEDKRSRCCHANCQSFASINAPLCSDSLRQRSTSINHDPFLGVTNEDDVIHELELLDLDRWNASYSCVASPSFNRQVREVEKERPLSWMDNSPDFPSFELDSNEMACLAPPVSPELNPLELDIDRACNSVNWEAWTKYLSEEGEELQASSLWKEYQEDASIESPMESVESLKEDSTDEYSGFPEQVKQELDEDSTHPLEVKPDFEDDLSYSGPLTWIPTDDSKSDEKKVSFGKNPLSLLRDNAKFGSSSPADYYSDEKVSFKKRGVKMKPSVDCETDRRRALNREAALRYREKKRSETMIKRRELQLTVERNKFLRQRERQLQSEISKLRSKLSNLGLL
ncbi:unnamed protein product [Caenorhabditis auriculariae]|uniref:BZIP domain-containing protein n=1 Tax=Caenorhabditis auriculariae TaxID=2777116 RepID=A0A8S1HE19_9PELO|nr:unnamed protein product [Caenorhabditis auriculariae]